MRKNVALVSMITQDFIPGYMAFIKSLLYHNPWFDLPIVLINIDLGVKEQNQCLKYYSNIRFVEPNRNAYRNVDWSKTASWLRNTYYTLDMFKYTQYDRVVFIDLDTLILDDIRYLFTHPMENFLGGVKGYERKEDELSSFINAGVMIADLDRMWPDFYNKIVKFASKGFRFPEQEALNKFLHGRIDYFPKCYNVEKRMLLSRNYSFDIEEVKILHFVALKPWQRVQRGNQKKDREDFKELEKLWWSYYEY